MSPPSDAGRQRWGRPSVIAAMRDLLGYDSWSASDDDGSAVTLTLRPRASVNSREWWSLSWHAADGGRHLAESQYLDVLLRRAAEWCDVADAEQAESARKGVD